MERDCILVVGVTSIGKTTALNELKKYAQLKKIPYSKNALSDAMAIVRAIEEDDACGGYHHTHDWCADMFGSHKHKNGESKFPFIVTDNVVPEKMLGMFSQSLEEAPFIGKLYFVEWAGGVNVCSISNPLSQVNFSYTRAYKMLKDAVLPSRWLHRIRGVIHLTANDSVRLLLNKKTPTLVNDNFAAKYGWRRSEITLNFFGQDDYDISGLKTFFDKHNIPTQRIENDASTRFFARIRNAAGVLL